MQTGCSARFAITVTFDERTPSVLRRRTQRPPKSRRTSQEFWVRGPNQVAARPPGGVEPKPASRAFTMACARFCVPSLPKMLLM